MVNNMNGTPLALYVLLGGTIYLIGVVLSLVIAHAIIKSAVLGALRKHDDERNAASRAAAVSPY